MTESNVVENAWDDETAAGDETDDEALDLPPEARRVWTRNVDERVESIVSRIRKGRLIVQPEFQRQFVWNKGKASRLVESILIGLPLPTFYMAEMPNGAWEAVDGQQRLTSLFSFFDGVFPDGQPFRLTGMKVRSDLKGKLFRDLTTEDQAVLEDYALRIVVIQKEADPDLKYEVFERLNSGAQVLSDMELRNCVYRGPYNNMLKDLASNPYLLRVRGVNVPHAKMQDRQLILRFFAMCRQTHLKYRAPVKQFMNHEIENYRFASPQELAKLRELFENAIQNAYDVFGGHAFRRYTPGDANNPDGKWDLGGTLNVALWDTILYTFSFYERRQVIAAGDAVREEFLDLLTSDPVFVDYIGRTTDKPDRIRYRADAWRQRMDKIIYVPLGEKRGFSRELKIQFYKESSSCAICGQHITDVNDSELDHIKHYWRGGATIPENARLSHRYCNRRRGGRE